jgi:predicted transcriptional regulator
MESKPKREHKIRVTFTMDPDLYRKMRKLIDKTERSMSWTICRAVKLLLESKIF